MPENTRAIVGETATFKCSPPKGHPDPVITWTHNDHPIDLNGGHFKLSGHDLVINVAKQDHGKYRCIAQNSVAVRESPPAFLKVLGKFKVSTVCLCRHAN